MTTESEQGMNDSQVGLLDDNKAKVEGQQQIEMLDVTVEENNKKNSENDEEKKEGDEEQVEESEGKGEEKKKGGTGGLRSWFKSPKRKSNKDGEDKKDREESKEEMNDQKEKQEKVETEVKEVDTEDEFKEKVKKERKPWFQKHKKEKQSDDKDGKVTEVNGSGGGMGSEPSHLTYQINVLDRDDRHINDVVKIDLEDVLAEPDGSHSVEGMWKASAHTFQFTKLWVYRIFAIILSLPAALLCGSGFALLTLLHIWFVQPLLKMFSVVGGWINQFLTIVLNALVTPIMVSLSSIFANFRLNHSGTVHRIHDA